MGKLGLQLYSVKDAAEKDLLGTIRKVSEMGYEGAQFAGFFNHSAEDVKAEIDAAGIVPAGAHVGIDQLENNLDETIKFHQLIGNDLIICPYLPENMRSGSDEYYQTAAVLNKLGKQLKESGIAFGYHNHAFEFDSFDGKTGFDILYENTDPAYVKMELDCFWASNAGYDPLEIIEKYDNRCVSLHIKDMKVAGDKKVSTEIGTGTLDIGKLIESGKKHQVDWFVVEQEDFTKDPLVSAEENASELKKIIG
ncbi:hypothetical protein CIL05_00855 [Virgibacillus profundi]|uniref:Xylose isomerase-like TIM barrel domain-containing protein n=1 Tax=Virgibacillus profundi TaxID=2024555 RepID=A0A2A2IHY8_9BACI|nr:sugar phosphate isomerase/epimerase [Virgibacillus profundi]PAV31237.1 hypothetical protein CIL05_00855 [Virgibacillus profundi]PXY55422.1 sugar phosphate isomerase/epimerase [Virgibacillus profundi]